MIQYFFERTFNVSPSELPRVFYGWALKFFYRLGYIIGWTVVVEATVTRFSIGSLPIIFLGLAFFTIVGMMFFSVMVDRVSAKQLLNLNVFFAAATLLVAFLNYQNSTAFIVLVLVAAGMFLSQISIILSNYLEDFFTPLEAERLVPTIESSETVGGILGGILLASAGFSGLGEYLILFWVGSLGVFAFVMNIIYPRLPFYLEKLDRESHEKYHSRFGWNSIVKSVDEIRKVPFLQILLTVLVFHWIIANFIEFLYTKAVDESVHVVTDAEHEASLTQGLGSLHIFFHSSALFVELFVSSRILKSLGTFAGFMIHVVVTILSAFSLLFGYGFVSALLARNNFEMTTIVQRNAYETSYYAFRYGTLRSLREFFEGIVYPASTIIGTLLIIGIELFFVESDLMYVVPFMLVSLSLGMGLFALQLQKRYTHMTIQNLYSSIPIAQYHAVEIISRKGYKQSLDHLMRVFKRSHDSTLKLKIIASLSSLGDIKAVHFLLVLLKSSDARYCADALRSLRSLGQSLQRTKMDDEVRGVVSERLKSFIAHQSGQNLQLLALRALVPYDALSVADYLETGSSLLRAEAAIQLWGMNLERKKILHLVRTFLHSRDKEHFHALAHMVGEIPVRDIQKALEKYPSSDDEELRLVSFYSLIKANKFRYLPGLINLLLYGNEVIFEQGVELIQRLNSGQKRKVAHALMPITQLEQLPRTDAGKRMLHRVSEVYDACDAHDERAYLSSLVPAYSVS